MKFLVILSLVLFLSACSSVQYVVKREVPINPSVTVMTTYGTPDDLRYASELEETLINFGISVVSPPARINTKKSTSNKNSDGKITATV